MTPSLGQTLMNIKLPYFLYNVTGVYPNLNYRVIQNYCRGFRGL